MTVRMACAADAEALRRLNEAFNEVDNVSAEDIRRALARSAELVAVAEIDGQVIGFCCAQVHHSFCYGTPSAEITELYVDEAHQRRGCGSALLRFMEKVLREQHGVHALHLLTGCANQAAQALYRSVGYEAKAETYMRKTIG